MLRIDVYSFGYLRSGVPPDRTENGGGFVFDCRFLPNPGREARFALNSGLDDEVRTYLESYAEVEEFLVHVFAIVDRAVDQYRERAFTHLQAAFGCTGGQHRSVYCAERLAEHLRERGVHAAVTHTEQGRWW